MTVDHVLLIVVVAFASYRAARAIAVDTITARFRMWAFGKAYPGIPEGFAGDVNPALVTSGRPWRWFYGLVSCPFCIGFWLSIGFWFACDPGYKLPVASAVAVAGVQTLLTSVTSE